MVATCPTTNTAAMEQGGLFSGPFGPHRIGWIIAGSAAAVTCLIALVNILCHARNYNRPLEQRQVIRILLLPPIYAIVEFFSYRYYTEFFYYSIAVAASESIVIAAFLLLLLQYIGDSEEDQKAIFAQKEKKPLPLPFCCWRYRPSKAYFTIALKWSVIQYVLIGPALAIAGVVTHYYGVYCPTSLSYHFARVYLVSVEFVSISIALYGLFVLYVLIKDDLKGRRPLSKFMTIKVIIFLVFYQGFVFDILADYGVIKATTYWTTTNIANGLNSLCICVEMTLIALWQVQAFYWGEYRYKNVRNPNGKPNEKGKTNVFWSILHALNFADFAVELWREIRFFFDRLRGKEYTRQDERFKFDFVQAFGSDEDDQFKGKPADLPLQLAPQGSSPSDNSRPSGAEMREASAENGHGGYASSATFASPPYAYDYHGNKISATQDSMGHSQQSSAYQQVPHDIVQPSMPAYGRDEASYGQAYQDPASAHTAPHSRQEQHANGNLDPSSATHNAIHRDRPLSGYQSRPLSWEPQAM